jgi:hypothetical protein
VDAILSRAREQAVLPKIAKSFISRYMGANENFVPVVVKSGGAPCLAF